jgi:cytochrome c5
MISNLRILTDSQIIWMVFLLAVCLCCPLNALAQDAASMPEAEGRDLVATQCSTCHALSTPLIKRASKKEWEETVTRMITTYKAPINATDKIIIIDYLSANYGAGAASDLGQETVAAQCFQCHGDGMWHDLKTDRNGWLSVIYRMIGRGGIWTPEQIASMADYLASTTPAGGGE